MSVVRAVVVTVYGQYTVWLYDPGVLGTSTVVNLAGSENVTIGHWCESQ